jgi:hypothetical protein
VATLVQSDLVGRVALVGAQALSLRDYLGELRMAMGLGQAHFVAMPPALLSAASEFGAGRWGVPDKETLAMLERGNTADPAATATLLGGSPRPVREFIPRHTAAAISVAARMDWLGGLLRISIALVWIITGVLSLGVYPASESYLLLERVGIPHAWQALLLYCAALLDLLLGFATLALWRSRWLWLVQALVMLSYMAIITLKLPEYWMHPFGPVLKNLPMLAAIWLLYEMDRR